MDLKASSKDWSLGDRIRYARHQRGYTQREVQERGGPGKITLIRLEQGRGDVETTYRSTLENLAAVLECRLDWLINGEGEIWLEGKQPPTITQTGIAVPSILSKARPPRRDEHPVELGQFVSDGPIDWAIVGRAVQLMDTAMAHDSKRVRRACSPFSLPHALLLLYRYLSQQDDPLGRVRVADIAMILSVASR